MFKRSVIARVVPGVAVVGVLVASYMAGPLGLFGSLAGYGYGACGYGYAYSGAPVVTGVSPNFGSIAGGTTATITGHGFCNNLLAVQFGGVNSTGLPDVISDTQARAVSPAHAAATVDVTVINAAGTSAISAADHFTYIAGAPGTFTPTAPTRVLDTRESGPKLGPGASRVLTLAGVGPVPANATAVVLNVTAAATTTSGDFTVYPTAGTRPTSSNLNWIPGQVVPNLVMVGLGAGGAVTIYNAKGSAHAVVDLEGYYAPSAGGSAGGFVALAPSRIEDTRNGSGVPIGANGTLNVQITGAGGVPALGAESVVLNATVTKTTTGSFLVAYPTGTSRPTASNLNWVKGKTIANRVSVPIGAGGMVTFYNAKGKTALVLDVNGYFTDATASGKQFTGVTPNRDVDTRSGIGGPSGKITAGTTRVVTVAGVGGVPLMTSATPPTAVVINVTATGPTGSGYFTVFPGGTLPLASDVNYLVGGTVPNLVVVQVSATGTVSVYVGGHGATNLVIDVVGWFG